MSSHAYITKRLQEASIAILDRPLATSSTAYFLRPSGASLSSTELASIAEESSVALPDFLDIALSCLMQDGSIYLSL